MKTPKKTDAAPKRGRGRPKKEQAQKNKVGRPSKKTEQATSALSVSSAFRFLSGESKTDRLGLWCALSGNPVWKVKAAVKDKEEIVRKMRSIMESTGRGKKQKKRATVPGARENLMIGGA